MSAAIDTGIGLAFLYLLLALIVTTLQELTATWLRFRARDLYAALADMLASRNAHGSVEHQQLLQQFYEHPLIKNLCQRKALSNLHHLPSYIPSRTFALALLDVLQKQVPLSDATQVRPLLSDLERAVSEIPIPALKESLLLIIRNADLFADRVDSKANAIVSSIETWFNDRMARLSGWYKRRAQIVSLVLAGALAFATNADTLHVAKSLWANASLRESIVARAQAYVAQPPAALASSPAALASSPAALASPPTAALASPPAALASPPTAEKSAEGADPAADAKKLQSDLAREAAALQSSGLPLGWSIPPDRWSIIGWLLTTLAVSLGAGFWFDVLSKALQLRGTGPKVSASTGETIGNGK